MGQIRWRHKLTRALSKRRLALAEPKTWQRKAANICLDVLPSIVSKFLSKGDVVCCYESLENTGTTGNITETKRGHAPLITEATLPELRTA